MAEIKITLSQEEVKEKEEVTKLMGNLNKSEKERFIVKLKSKKMNNIHLNGFYFFIENIIDVEISKIASLLKRINCIV